jgi:hypothetical protein
MTHTQKYKEFLESMIGEDENSIIKKVNNQLNKFLFTISINLYFLYEKFIKFRLIKREEMETR